MQHLSDHVRGLIYDQLEQYKAEGNNIWKRVDGIERIFINQLMKGDPKIIENKPFRFCHSHVTPIDQTKPSFTVQCMEELAADLNDLKENVVEIVWR